MKARNSTVVARQPGRYTTVYTGPAITVKTGTGTGSSEILAIARNGTRMLRAE